MKHVLHSQLAELRRLALAGEPAYLALTGGLAVRVTVEGERFRVSGERRNVSPSADEMRTLMRCFGGGEFDLENWHESIGDVLRASFLVPITPRRISHAPLPWRIPSEDTAQKRDTYSVSDAYGQALFDPHAGAYDSALFAVRLVNASPLIVAMCKRLAATDADARQVLAYLGDE